MIIWSWTLTILGLVVLWLAGRKLWWAWVIGIGMEVLWLIYSLKTKQTGFILGTAVYTFIYGRNAILWRRQDKEASKCETTPT